MPFIDLHCDTIARLLACRDDPSDESWIGGAK